MITPVNKSRRIPGGDNKGSSAKLVSYLDKENTGVDAAYRDEFFNH